MNTVGNRIKFALDVSSLDRAINILNEKLQLGEYLDALDICERLVAKYPQKAIPLLSNTYDTIYKSLRDKGDRFYLYQARYFDFGIRKGDKVLDIGSGNMPFPYTTHLADIALTNDNYGRAGAPFKYQDDKPVYECNIEKLSFGDKEFDFIYCSHVLEHVNNPERACDELMRVGKRGYIEMPTRGKDLFFDYAKISNHKWAVEYVHSKLVFTEYTNEEIEGLTCNVLNQMFECPETQREKAFSALVYLKANLINTMLLWDTKFDYEVRRLADVPGAKTNPKDKNKNNSIYPVENYERGNITNKSPNENSVSVVVPAYNRQKTIERAIASALQQNYPVHEIIVVDDCSTDNTVQIIQEFVKHDSRIKLLRHERNKGAQAARNAGIRNATGEWIAFLDSDDEWLPTRLQAGFDLQEREGFNVIHSQCYITEGNDNNPRNMGIPSLSGNIYKELLKRPFPMFQGLLVKRECLERIGYLDEAITSFQEWDTSIRLARHYEFGFVSEPLFIYHRCHSEDTISNDKYKDAEGYYQIVEKHADEIIKYAGTEALINHYMITLEKLKALTAYEKFQQVKVKLKALIDSEKKELTINGGVKEVPNRMY